MGSRNRYAKGITRRTRRTGGIGILARIWSNCAAFTCSAEICGSDTTLPTPLAPSGCCSSVKLIRGSKWHLCDSSHTHGMTMPSKMWLANI
ncbi:hypothetical protein BJV78DRAFT_1176742 [Lactifluus subvellereus]|nr:hypothetical protein BJV78DRAFT_1176742 [Lactifluus subvellereus]